MKPWLRQQCSPLLQASEAMIKTTTGLEKFSNRECCDWKVEGHSIPSQSFQIEENAECCNWEVEGHSILSQTMTRMLWLRGWGAYESESNWDDESGAWEKKGEGVYTHNELDAWERECQSFTMEPSRGLWVWENL